ncbi:MAG: 3-deoxy-D-manno-octulosonic acid transferase [Melioribacteraceae bacterium]|nr:3-deoxy-D-manno-octulosonic acid transferase [Melioribacteraceae bacterium]
MLNFWYYIYNFIALPLLLIFFNIVTVFNKKVRESFIGRRRLYEELIINLTGFDRKKKLIWFHSSSMGEFEQAKPIIQKIKSEKDVNIIVTFFSPSGYNNSQNYPYADIVSYLPFDTPSAVSRFLKLVRPNMAVFMRYDIWPNYIWQLNRLKIPSFIVDATMRPNSVRKAPFAKSFHKSLYKNVTKILTVSEKDLDSFKDFGINDSKLSAVGDTRFDRVHYKSLQAKDKKLFKSELFSNKKVFVVGSSWEADEEVLLPVIIKSEKYSSDSVFILCPHEPTIPHLENLENQLSSKNIKSIRFSHMNNYDNESVIIIDSIGILLSLYYYADAAYVGGSFKQGIHNVLEPAVYGIPVFFGPKIENSQEALKMVKLKNGILVKNKKEAYKKISTILRNDKIRNELGEISTNYITKNLGASEKIIHEIYNTLKI